MKEEPELELSRVDKEKLFRMIREAKVGETGLGKFSSSSNFIIHLNYTVRNRYNMNLGGYNIVVNKAHVEEPYYADYEVIVWDSTEVLPEDYDRINKILQYLVDMGGL